MNQFNLFIVKLLNSLSLFMKILVNIKNNGNADHLTNELGTTLPHVVNPELDINTSVCRKPFGIMPSMLN